MSQIINTVIPAIRDSVISTCFNLKEQTYPPHIIIVVNNGLSENTLSKLRTEEKIKIAGDGENKGSAGGYKVGFEIALKIGCDAVFASDDDVQYDERAIEKLKKILFSSKDTGAVRCAWSGYSGGIKEVETSVWTGTLIKSEVIEKIGFPNEEFFLYGDDVDFFLRMRKWGYKMLIVPEARYKRRIRDNRLGGSRGGGIYSQDFRLYYAFRNEIYIWTRWWKLWRAMKTLLHLIKNVPKMSVGGILSSLDGIKDGFLGKLGKNEKYKITIK